jgi:hypothetical protein
MSPANLSVFSIVLTYYRKTKILVSKKGVGKLKKNEKWFIYDQLIEVVSELCYLGITLESREDGTGIGRNK